MRKLTAIIVLMMIQVTTATAQWPVVTAVMRPWTRWWWMGNAVDSAGIKAQLGQLRQAGIGGVEIVPIYGAKGAEADFIPYLSPRWLAMLDATVAEAGANGMGVYVSVGSGWPIGGPQVREEDAASKLVIQQYSISSQDRFTEKIILKDEKQSAMKGAGLSALMAYGPEGEALDITDKIGPGGVLSWQPPSIGSWQLYAAFNGKTRQKVKRAAPGGEGYTLDHFSATAPVHYLAQLDQVYGLGSRGVAAFYNDSYEVFNADWTPEFFTVFKQKRGYDLRLYLRELVSKDTTDKIARIKSDYRETMSDMMLHHFAFPFREWAHKKGSLFLNQAHGSPANLLDLYAAADIAETETFGSSQYDIKGLRRDSADIRNVDPDPDMMKFASSAAHVAGHNLVSSETFTWLTEHFKTSWSQCKPEAEQVFLAGINHIFFHGTTYSPPDAPWPGWLFYASVECTPANSLWPQLKAMNDYITRCQSILQSGEPDNEVLAYWPVYDAWHNAGGTDMPFRVHDVDEWLYGTDFHKNIQQLQKDGFALDFVSDHMLSQASCSAGGQIGISEKGGRYKVLLVSHCKKMPLATVEHIVRLAQQGATIVMQALPEDVPGWADIDARRDRRKAIFDKLQYNKEVAVTVKAIGKGRIIFAANVEQGLVVAGITPEAVTKTGLKFIRRKAGDGKYYYLVNHTDHDIDTTLTLNDAARSVMLLDPQNGYSGLLDATPVHGRTQVRVQLKSGMALFLKTCYKPLKGKAWTFYTEKDKGRVLDGPWNLEFTAGGPSLPKPRQLPAIQYWTDMDDTAAQAFAGTAAYTHTFQLATEKADEYLLQLPHLRESAHVWVNGEDAGYIWSNPMELQVGRFLKKGSNTIRIEVVNLMANRIRDMDRKRIVWRNYHEINFVNINYKDFDASGWPVTPSGIGPPVVLVPLKATR